MSIPPEVPEGFCRRGDYCAGRTIAIENGERIVTPAETPRPFCQACMDFITECLDELPDAYRRLATEIGERPRTGRAVRQPFGPRLAIREDVDALMRLMAATLCSWEARTRAQAGWNPRSSDHPVDSYEAVAEAVRVLRELPSVVNALEPKWMSHALPLAPGKASTRGRPWGEIPAELEELYGEREMVRRGEDFLTIQFRLGAQDAGSAILKIRARCLRVLGENRPQAEIFEGVPCRQCGDMGTLEHAEPPSDPAKEAMHSRCCSCDHRMGLKDFQRWATWYSRWADGQGFTCRRCADGNCAECIYGLCSCPKPVAHPRRRQLRAALIAA